MCYGGNQSINFNEIYKVSISRGFTFDVDYFFVKTSTAATIAMTTTKMKHETKAATRLSHPPTPDLDESEKCDVLLFRVRDSLKAF